MIFTNLPFGLLNLFAGFLLVLQFIDASPAAEIVTDGPEIVVHQFIDFANYPPEHHHDEFYIEQEPEEEEVVYSDEDGDVLQFQGSHDGHEDVVFVNDEGEVEVQEFVDVDLARKSSSSEPRPTSASPSDASPSPSDNVTRDFSPDTTEDNSTKLNFTPDQPEANSTLMNTSTERSFTDSYSTGNGTFGNSTGSPDEEEEGDGLLDGILNFFENLFNF